MSVIIQGYQLREIGFGVQVIKPAQLQPQTATANLYTISGGAVLVTGVLGLVSVLTPATTNTLSLGLAPTVGTASTTSVATAVSTASLEAGTWLGLVASSSHGGALIVGTNASTALYLNTPFVASAGTITWTTTGSAATGKITWYLTYVPLDNGASVS